MTRPRLTDAEREIAELADAATPGPWSYDDGITDDATGERGKVPAVYQSGTADWICSPEAVAFEQADADGRFLAAARTAVPALLSALSLARAELARVKVARDSVAAAEARGAERERARAADALAEAGFPVLASSIRAGHHAAAMLDALDAALGGAAPEPASPEAAPVSR